MKGVDVNTDRNGIWVTVRVRVNICMYMLGWLTACKIRTPGRCVFFYKCLPFLNVLKIAVPQCQA